MKHLLIFISLVSSYPVQILAMAIPVSPYSIVQDTVIQNDTLSITPYFGKTQANALGNFGVVTRDKIAFQTYAGFNVINTLRGHVPSSTISPNAPYATGGFRSEEPMLVIDGLPYSHAITDHYNLNSFGYSGITAFGSGNAAALYGEPGSNGAVFLKSKTGEGFTKPTVEFNSFSSLAWNEEDIFLGVIGSPDPTKTTTQWMLTNTAAYQQDFGKIDTRVSYQYSFLPDGSSRGDFTTGNHALKMNTGFNFTQKLSVRLILDGIQTNTERANNLENSTTVSKTLLGNLVLRYQVADWLQLSSQSSLCNLPEESDISGRNSWEQINEQKRVFTNLFASFKKSLLKKFSVSAFAGTQIDRWELSRDIEVSSNHLSYNTEYRAFSLLGGAGLQVSNYLFADFNYRQDQLSFVSPDETTPTYSIASSFVFSEALRLKSSWFTLGKIRGNFGETTRMNHMYIGYPFHNYTLPEQPFVDYSKKMTEAGVDLSFFSNRITLSASFFKDRYDLFVEPSDPSSGFSVTIINAAGFENEGFELVVGGSWIKKKNLSIDSKLIWSNDGKPTSSSGVPNSNPDWTGSFLNQLTWKNFFTSLLLNVRKGGDVFNYSYSNGTMDRYWEDGSQIKLRDLSVGYKFSTEVLSRLSIQQAQVSLSGRNFWIPYSKSENDPEEVLPSSVIYQKSASLSLTLMF